MTKGLWYRLTTTSATATRTKTALMMSVVKWSSSGQTEVTAMVWQCDFYNAQLKHTAEETKLGPKLRTKILKSLLQSLLFRPLVQILRFACVCVCVDFLHTLPPPTHALSRLTYIPRANLSQIQAEQVNSILQGQKEGLGLPHLIKYFKHFGVSGRVRGWLSILMTSTVNAFSLQIMLTVSR